MAMSDTYTARILEDILRGYLRQGIIPTADQLDEDYQVRIANHADMSKPFLLDAAHTVEEYESSSAAKYNAFFQQAKIDLDAIYDEVWTRSVDTMRCYERWRAEFEAMKKRLRDLDRRIDSLLILRGDTTGYFSFVEDSFTSLGQVDQTQTTTRVDAESHTVTIGETESSTLDANSIPVSDVVFTLLTRDYVVANQAATGTASTYAIQDITRAWQQIIKTSRGDKPVSAELVIKLGTSVVGISQIIMDLHSSDSASPMTITALYSTDGYNWQYLPCPDYSQASDSKVSFFFPQTDMRWVKLIMSKPGPDDFDGANYSWEFGASSIKFFTASYDTTGSMLYSTALQSLDQSDQPRLFRRAALEACQTTQDGTGIRYWVKAKLGATETDWARIAPYNVASPDAALEIDFGGNVDTTESSLAKVDKAAIDSTDYFAQYSNTMECDKVALVGADTGNAYKISLAVAQRMIDKTIKVYLNLGVHGGSTDLVRKAPRGWRIDETGAYLDTTILVKQEVTLNFGSSKASIDGEWVKQARLLPGIPYSFRALVSNTYDIPLQTWLTEDDLKLADPLYPYNHRKIVEGVTYDPNFSGDKLYPGVDLFCGHYGKRVGIFDLINNVQATDFSKFAVDNMPDGSRVFAIRFDPADIDGVNEQFALEYGTNENTFDTIYLKAELFTNSALLTPVLTAYRVKLGY